MSPLSTQLPSSRVSSNLVKLVTLISGLIFGIILSNIYHSPVEYRWHRVTIDNASYGHEGEDAIALELFSRVKVFCIIVVTLGQYNKVQAINSTWAQRCNAHVFLPTALNKHSSLKNTPLSDATGNSLWKETKVAIQDTIKKDDNFDFFLVAAGDSYLLMENLRKFLLPLSPSKEILLMNTVTESYVSVFSRAGVKKLMAWLAIGKCWRVESTAWTYYDKLTKCAQLAELQFVHSVDSEGAQLFHSLSPWRYYQDTGKVLERSCCSKYSVSFAKVEDVFLMDYLFYHLHAYGIHRDYQDYLDQLVG